ncbi:hypothetical protein DSO57_1024104 [Entomophthora muscae]|uniref:Uncharacterized protein n=1 Tax=Entomophthora muscae TaxID=34485 RepID=A0ACC2T2J8_9FUNG|nr:hypothetical protein DSO57_1024104 [Entomophthora muscae]
MEPRFRMRIVPVLVLSAAASYFPTCTECLISWIDETIIENPKLACAFFKKDHSRKKGKRPHVDVYYCGIYRYQRFCANVATEFPDSPANVSYNIQGRSMSRPLTYLTT